MKTQNDLLRRGRALAIAVAAALTLLSPALLARAAGPDVDPETRGEGTVDFVGRYGEVFKLRGGWQLVPFMSHGTEVVNLYPMRDRRAPAYSLETFKPRPADFVPENFTPLGLIQLMIIPRSSAPARSLAELRKAKIADLNASGVRYEVIDDPFFPPSRGRWPEGTFEIKVTAPYLLTQLYTATPSYDCVLTAGIDTPPSTFISRHYRDLRYGLAVWVVPQDRPAVDESPAATVARGVSFHAFSVPAVWRAWSAITGLALLSLLLGVKMGWEGLRRVCASLLIFSNAGAALGGAVALLFWPFAWFTHHSPLLVAITCAFQPLLALAVGRVRGSGVRRRALLGMIAWALTAGALMVYCGAFDWGAGDGGGRSRYLFALGAIDGFGVFAIGGIIFGLLDSGNGGPAGGRVALALALALVLPSAARAQPATEAALEAARTAARGRMKADHVTPESFRQGAIEALAEKGGYYDYQRVEIRGILSPDTADNETTSVVGPIFDHQISPTHLRPGDGPVELPRWLKAAVAGSEAIEDLASLNQDARNEITSAAETAVKELNGKEVNEIVAHSWGTEIVYNAILTGKILPPRRLLVFGMPDLDLEKWKVLSKFTGTEVVVYTDTEDPIAGKARLGQALNTSIAAAAQTSPYIDGSIGGNDVLKNIRGGDAAEFERQWMSACQKIECNPHDRQAPDVVYRDDYKGKTHNRFEYYGAAQENNDLPMPPLGDQLTGKYTAFPGSVKAMQAEQNARMAREERLLYREAIEAEAVKTERSDEGAKAGGDESFYDAAGKLAPLLQSARDEFPVQEAAAFALWQKSPEYLAYRAHMIALEEAARARESAEQQARADMAAAEERARQDHYADMKNRWEYLRTMTALACSDPDGLERLGRGGEVSGVAIGDLDLEWEMSRTEGPGRPVVNSCQKYVLTALRKSAGLVHGRSMLAWARRYREEHPSLLARFTSGIGEMFAAMVRTRGDALPESGGGTSSGDDDRRERAGSRGGGGLSDTDREQWKKSWEAQARDEQEIADKVHAFYSQHSPDNWSSLNQLRGVANH